MNINEAIIEVINREGISYDKLANQMGYKTGARGLRAKLFRPNEMITNSAVEMLTYLGYKMVVMPEEVPTDPLTTIVVGVDFEKLKYSKPE